MLNVRCGNGPEIAGGPPGVHPLRVRQVQPMATGPDERVLSIFSPDGHSSQWTVLAPCGPTVPGGRLIYERVDRPNGQHIQPIHQLLKLRFLQIVGLEVFIEQIGQQAVFARLQMQISRNLSFQDAPVVAHAFILRS